MYFNQETSRASVLNTTEHKGAGDQHDGERN